MNEKRISLSKRTLTYGMGIISNAHCGKNGIVKNFNPTKNDGAYNAFSAATNSDSCSLSKHPGSMLNAHLMTFSVVNRRNN